jgi:hypothetical protein
LLSGTRLVKFRIADDNYQFAIHRDPASAIDSYLESHKGKPFVMADTATAAGSASTGRHARIAEGAAWSLFIADRAA